VSLIQILDLSQVSLNVLNVCVAVLLSISKLEQELLYICQEFLSVKLGVGSIMIMIQELNKWIEEAEMLKM
jgi:hypothetical protein